MYNIFHHHQHALLLRLNVLVCISGMDAGDEEENVFNDTSNKWHYIDRNSLSLQSLSLSLFASLLAHKFLFCQRRSQCSIVAQSWSNWRMNTFQLCVFLDSFGVCVCLSRIYAHSPRQMDKFRIKHEYSRIITHLGWRFSHNPLAITVFNTRICSTCIAVRAKYFLPSAQYTHPSRPPRSPGILNSQC